MAPERRSRRALIAALVFATSLANGAAAAPRVDPPSDSPLELALVNGVVAARAETTVRDLVRLGPRMGGTSSGDRSAEYLHRRFAEMGLQVEEILDKARPTHEETSFEARLVAPEDIALDAWPVGFSPSLATSLLHLARGKPDELDSTWALLTDEPPGRAERLAAKLGAVAALTDAPRVAGRYLDWAPAQEFPDGRVATLPVFTLSLHSGERLRRALDAGRKVTVRLGLDARTSSGRPRTIIATLPGDMPGWYLVCAHGDSDSGGPGADDNASGVASLLEAARALAAASASGMLGGHRPSLRFAVWGSEIHSSREFAASRAAAMGSLLGVINYDQTAAATEKDALYFEGNDISWNAALLRALMLVAADHAGRDDFPTQFTTTPSLGGTDGQIFLPAEAGGAGILKVRVPVTTVFTAAWGKIDQVAQTAGWQSPAWPEIGIVRIDYSRVYHSSGDTPAAATDGRGGSMARCARVVALALSRLVASPPAPVRPLPDH